MTIEFFKMHAQGNDYIFFDFLHKKEAPPDLAMITPPLCDRHLGIGADGTVLILPDRQCDAYIRIYNRDGSEAENCGSALRCLTGYFHQQFGKKKSVFNTRSGIKTGEVLSDKAKTVTRVNMGNPVLLRKSPEKIWGLSGYLVNIGNPHFVIITDELISDYTRKKGPLIASSKKFPTGVNVDFMKILNRNSIQLSFWERGSGETLACGSGTCACAFCGFFLGLLSEHITAAVPGGVVAVELCSDGAYLAGEVSHVFSGKFSL